MGKSAKLHKRHKQGKASSSSISHAKSQANPTAPPRPVPPKPKSKKLKPKTSGNRESHVLGGADYVTLMMGGRAKAREEAAKLPMDED